MDAKAAKTDKLTLDEAVEAISEAAIDEFDIPCGADKLYAMRDFEKATTAILTRLQPDTAAVLEKLRGEIERLPHTHCDEDCDCPQSGIDALIGLGG